MSEPIAVLVIGVGSIGERHVRCFLNTGRARVSICEPLQERRDQVASRYDIAHAYGSLDAALEHTDRFNVAVICVPANHHVPMALRLADAGLHLLIEKPLSTTLDQVTSLERIVAEKKLVAAVAYVYRQHPCIKAMRDAIQQNRFGRPVQLVANSGQHFPTYRPAYREIYYTDHETGGGAVQDALTHTINTGQWMVGPIDRLAADADHQVLAGVHVEDTVHVIARHGPVMGCYSLNQHQAPNELTISVHCTEGSARFEHHKNRWRWMTQPGSQWHDEQIDDLPRDHLFLTQANDFLDAIEHGRTPACTLPEAVHTLRANLAILAAGKSRAWQVVQAET